MDVLPGRSCLATRKATSGCSRTRAHRGARYLPGWLRPSGPGRPPSRAELGSLARAPASILSRACRDGPAATGLRRDAATAVPGLVDPLAAARELEVLGLIASGTPNPRIAEKLMITLDTADKHASPA